MPDIGVLSLSGAKVAAIAGKARLVNSVIHLFKSDLVPSPTTLLATYLANECDFDGYIPQVVAAWGDPKLAGSGYAIYAPTLTFSWNFVADGEGNQVGGFFCVLAGGEQYLYGAFTPTRPCMGPDQAIIFTPTDLFPTG